MLYVKYNLSQDAINKSFVETGVKAEREQRVEIDPTVFTPEDRQLMVRLEWTKFLDDTRPGRASFMMPALNQYKITGGIFEPRLDVGTAEFDHVLTAEEALDFIRQMEGMKQQLVAELPAKIEEYQARHTAEMERREVERAARIAAQEQREIEQEAARQAKREAAMMIPWGENGKAIFNLYEAIKAAADVEMDSRFRNWIKEVTGIAYGSDNGFTFEGSWVERGTVEIERGTKHVYLVAGTSGSRKNQTTEYRVVVLTADGILEQTDIVTDNDLPGWALRIRDRVAALLS